MTEDEKKMLDTELKNLRTMKDIAHFEGVQMLVKDAKAVVVNTVEILGSGLFDRTDREIRDLCATLKANLEIYQKITGIDSQIEAIEKAMEP